MEVIRRSGIVSDACQITARRSFFLVDQQGIVRQKWHPPEGEVFPSEEILKAVRTMQGKS